MNEKDYWFVCYCSKNNGIIEQIVDVLKKSGISYWKAPEMIPAGSNYVEEISEVLRNCSVFLFIVSKESQSSVWAEKEMYTAVNARKKIIPVRIDDTPLSEMYAFYMNNIQMIDVSIQANGKISKASLEKLYTEFNEHACKQSIVEHTTLDNTKTNESNDITTHVNDTQKKDIESEIEMKKIEARTNALRINKIPVFCKHCKMTLEHVDVGTYKCPICSEKYYDDFQKIKNYINDNGAAPAFMIARGTGVSKQAVESYFSDNVNMLTSKTNLAQTHEIHTERQLDRNSGSMWHSSKWKQ